MQTGTTLIEVLISLTLISILLLGVDAAQIYSLRQTKINYYYAAAQQQLNNMREHFPPDDAYTQTWNTQNHELLPQGRGVIANNKIAIFWGNNTNEQTCATNIINTTGCLQIHLA